MSSPTVLQRVGDAAKGFAHRMKALPPDADEQQAIKEKQAQVDALKAAPAAVPDRTGTEPMPMPRYGSRPGEKRLDYALKPSPSAVPLYDAGGDVSQSNFNRIYSINANDPDPTYAKPAAAADTSSNTPSLRQSFDTIKGKLTMPKFGGGSVGGVQDTALATPGYMPGGGPQMAAPAMPMITPGAAPVFDNGGDVKVQPVEKDTLAAPGQKKSPLAMKPIIHETMNVDTGKPSSSLPPLTPDIKPMSMPRVYDDGGDVDVNDGKHQVAILKEGEKVLTPEQAAAYRAGQQQGAPADFAGRVIPNPTGIKIKDVDSVQPRADEPTGGAKMSTDNAPLTPPKGDTSNAPLDEAQPTDASTGSQKARPYADVAAEQKKAAEEKVANPGAQTGGAQEPAETKIEPKLPTATDAERLAIKTDQQQAMGQGVNGLTKFGMANIYAKQLGLDSEDLSHVEDKLNPTTGDEGIKQPGYMPGGAPPAGIPKMGDVTLPGSTPPPQPTMGQTALQGTSDMGDQAKAGMPKLGQQSFKDQLSQLKKDHSAALGEGTAQGKVKADYIQAQINDLHKNNPWGSKENHPGALGKLGHIAAAVGNTAGNILVPNVMADIPGTEMNQRLAEKKLEARIPAEQEAATKQTAAEAKPGAQDVYKEATQGGLVDPAHTELGPQQAYVDEHDPSKVHFAGPMPPKEGKGSDQASFVKQWYADNPTVTKSAENDAKAIQAYHASTAPPTTLMVPVPGHPGMLQATQVQPGQQITEEAAKPGAAAAEENKFKGKTLYFDTPDGRQALSYQQAKDAGLNPEDGIQTNAAQVQKDRDKVESYNAIDKAFTRYKDDLNSAKLTPDDITTMTTMTTDKTGELDFASRLGAGVMDALLGHPLTGYSEKVMGGTLTKNQYEDLSPSGRKLVADYYSAMMAHFANMKATQGTIPRNPTIIQTEMHTVPKPYLSPEESGPSFQNYMDGIEGRNNNNVKFPEKQTKNENTAPPEGASHTGRSSVDGKLYYLDAQGNKLGPAPDKK